MPRPVSWLPRLHEIRRAVSRSTVSHLERKDIEEIFHLQPRAAQKLIELFPSTSVGTSRLVERGLLAEFLDKVLKAENANSALEQQRTATAATRHTKVRHLVRTDLPDVTLSRLPTGLTMSTGKLTIEFSTLEELAQTMFSVAQLLEHEAHELARLFEPKSPPTASPDADEVSAMFSDLAVLERQMRRSD